MERWKISEGVYEVLIDTDSYGFTIVWDYGDFVYASPTYHNTLTKGKGKGKVKSYSRYLEQVRKALKREGIIVDSFWYDERKSYETGEDMYRTEVLRRVEE